MRSLPSDWLLLFPIIFRGGEKTWRNFIFPWKIRLVSGQTGHSKSGQNTVSDSTHVVHLKEARHHSLATGSSFGVKLVLSHPTTKHFFPHFFCILLHSGGTRGGLGGGNNEAHLFRMSIQSVYRWVRGKRMPHYRKQSGGTYTNCSIDQKWARKKE